MNDIPTKKSTSIWVPLTGLITAAIIAVNTIPKYGTYYAILIALVLVTIGIRMLFEKPSVKRANTTTISEK